VDFVDFALTHLPKPPARVSFTGGRRAMAARLREFELVDSPPYDARVIAAWHSDWGDFGDELEATARSLPAFGALVLEVLVPELLDAPTLEWFHGQQRAIAAASGWEDAPRTPAESRAWLDVWYRRVPPLDVLRARLAAHFAASAATFVPVLFKHLGPVAEGLEETLVTAGAIRPVGLRYAGVRRPEGEKTSG
jgi:hypothetical protein